MIRFSKQRELYADAYNDYHDDIVWFVELLGFKIPVWRHVRITNRRVQHGGEE